MEKNWKLIIALGVLLIGISISYYFLYFIPKNKQAELLSENQVKCLQLKDKVFSEYNKQVFDTGGKRSDSDSDSASASNHYNTKLNKCLVEIVDNTFSKTGSITQSVQVVDAIEGTNLVTCIYGLGTDGMAPYCYKGIGDVNDEITKEQFEILDKEYMSQ